jgi:hypothetical protein
MVVVQTEIKKFEEPDHSWFSPSSAEANILCPGRINACKGLEKKDSAESNKGRIAHRWMELHYSNQPTTEAVDKFEPGSYQAEAVTAAVRQVDEYIATLLLMNGVPEIALEQKVFLPEYPRGNEEAIGGTIDMRLWFPLTSLLVILDFKFGQDAVFAYMNSQLLTYSAAALVDFPDAKNVNIVVCQPRVKDTLDIWHVLPSEVMEWKKSVLLPAIEKAKDPNAPRVAGPVQCKWCERAKVGCPEEVNRKIESFGAIQSAGVPAMPGESGVIIPKDFVPTVEALSLLPVDKLSELGKLLPFMEKAIEHLKEALCNRQMQGDKIEGFKLVRKNTHRKWKDETSADGYLVRKKLKEAERYTKKLISPSAAEKLIKVKDLPAASRTAFYALIEKPEGEIIAAPVTDKRAAVDPMTIAAAPAPAEIAENNAGVKEQSSDSMDMSILF